VSQSVPPVADIEVEAVPNCPSCNEPGTPLYSGLRDHTFGTPGEWACSQCSACGAIWLNPRPTAADIGKVYRTYYTHRVYAPGEGVRAHLGRLRALTGMVNAFLASTRYLHRNALASSMGYAEQATGSGGQIIARVLGFATGASETAWLSVLGLSAAERGRLLDVGCGNGTFLAAMKALGWETMGVETDAQAADVARTRFGVDVRIGTLEDVALPDRSFDAVSLSHVMEHVHDPVALMTECRRILRPGGRLIILTPNSRSLGHRIFRAAWRGLEPPRHLQLFNRNTLTTAAQRAGMRVTALRTTARMMQGIWDASRLIQRANAGLPKKNSKADYVTGYAMRWVERAARIVWSDAGEELVVVAVRQ
jgi:2-polyprenyl-3-methyl-5-hydroxy-6-metoxy-1,4-benzoquinol methylase